VLHGREQDAVVTPAELGDDARDRCAEAERGHVAELAAVVRRGRRRDDERRGTQRGRAAA